MHTDRNALIKRHRNIQMNTIFAWLDFLDHDTSSLPFILKTEQDFISNNTKNWLVTHMPDILNHRHEAALTFIHSHMRGSGYFLLMHPH